MPTCSGCLGEFSGLNDVTAHINASADAHSKTASEHRVNQPHSKQNQNLAKAAAINEKKVRIKLMHKGQVIHVELSMMLIDGRGKHYKCLLAPFPDVYPATDPIEAVLVELAQKLETNFLQSAYCLQFDNATYDFTFSSCMLNSIHGKKLYSIDKTGLAFKGNLDSLFTKLVNGGHLSKADQDARKLCLQLVVPFTIDEQEHLFKASKASVNMSRKRKHLSIADDDDAGQGSQHSKSSTPSLSRPSINYTGQWNQMSRSTTTITYEKFPFRKTVCHVSTNGDTHFEDLSDIHEIEVSKGWTRFVKTGVPNGGYLSKGLYKYGILARFNGNQVALFMHKPAGSSNNLNSTALHDKLDLLIQGDAFAKSFKNRALAANVKLPDLKYNAEGTFVETVTVPLPGSGLPIDDETVEQEAANCSLLFDTFLVVPLLQTK
ncbi:hypothetical protein GGU10DRAFT_334890, partial [Lentinula aff. detonsa]